ncbi:MAG: circularly permuted type 2 ATP-grasp protein [Magnetococcales bacterium]|nr:circularly permuted type 2 ATP-grasp protein [Magnetococcales bacterium]
MPVNWSSYPHRRHLDEMIDPSGQPRPGTEPLVDFLRTLGKHQLRFHKESARHLSPGVSTLSPPPSGESDTGNPFDIVPRVIGSDEWQRVEKGLRQRMTALNLFLCDLYGPRKIVTDNILPEEILLSSKSYRPACSGARPPFEVWANVCCCDLLRDRDGTLYVLEDNLRQPSGGALLLENRFRSRQIFRKLFEDGAILPVEDYPGQLLAQLRSLSREDGKTANVVILTSGQNRSESLEYRYLAQAMGIDAVDGSELVVSDAGVFRRKQRTLQKVDVIYRSIGDDLLDPEHCFPDSSVGVNGLLQAWHAGNVVLCNAPGAGIADDKAVYAFVPKMIAYYLGEEAILPNVQTFHCRDPREQSHVLAHLRDMVVKSRQGSGPRNMLNGPTSTREQREAFAARIKQHPHHYVAQPALVPSTQPTVVGGRLEPRPVELRTFIVQGKSLEVAPGGVTRVGLVKPAPIINFSPGNGIKDTWVVDIPCPEP